MPILPPIRFSVCFVATTTLFACGGASVSSDGTTGGNTGSSAAETGGSRIVSGGAASEGGANDKGGAVAYGGCCTAERTCDPGDTRIASLADCPIGASCYSLEPICCEGQRYCARAAIATATGGTSAGGAGGFGATGNVGTAATGSVGAATALGGKSAGGGGGSAGGGGGSAAVGNVGATTAAGGSLCTAPQCNEGLAQSGSNCTVASSSACYTVYAGSTCGIFTCISTSTVCDRSAEYNRRYDNANTAMCSVYDVLCPTGTVRFDNACGCGCEQPTSCPRWVDCMPGAATLDPLCVTVTNCPLTLRAL